ncbi:MAG: hypothetical protein ACFCUT_04305 [Kiloniellaceae bacterium]
MTSTIIGSLAHMPTDWAFRVLRAILGSQIAFPEGTVSEVGVQLWRRLGRVEPDAVIELAMDVDAEKRMLVIEAKWDSGFGDDQLHRQRQAFPNHHHHVLLIRRQRNASR